MEIRKIVRNRWSVSAAGILLEVALGAVCGWSVFRVPLAKQFGWSISAATLAFTTTIFVIGIAASFGSSWLARTSPRIIALTGALLYGLGIYLASFSDDRLWWLCLSYGVVAGTGVGLSYVVPVPVLNNWFPGRRKLILSMAATGFGAGALVTMPVGIHLIRSVGPPEALAYLGIALLVLTVVASYFMQDPSHLAGTEGENRLGKLYAPVRAAGREKRYLSSQATTFKHK